MRRRTHVPLASLLLVFAALAWLSQDLPRPARPAVKAQSQRKQAEAIRHNERGIELYNEGLYAVAAAEFDQAIALDPLRAVAYYNRGLAHLAKDDFDLAVADFTKAIELKVSAPADSYFKRGAAHRGRKDYDAAVADYTRAIELNPQGHEAYVSRGAVHHLKKDYDAAVEDFTRALALNPANVIIPRLLALSKEAQQSEREIGNLFNYPFADERDMRRVGALCLQLLRELGTPAEGQVEKFGPLQKFLLEAALFTNLEKTQGETYSIADFSRSDDKAIRRLRGEIRVPPPDGGAIVRLYRSKELIPEPIRAHFKAQTQAITLRGRFIAVFLGDKSRQELEDTISHELTHAYLVSHLGAGSDNLPEWFHEGLALHLSSEHDFYVSESRLGGETVSRPSEEYRNYRLVFRHLEKKLGRQGLANFIRQSIEQRSTEGPLRAAVGVASYEELLSQVEAEGNVWIAKWVGALLISSISAWLTYALWRRRKRSFQPELADASAVSYCPVCKTEYTKWPGRCSDHPDIALVRFDPSFGNAHELRRAAMNYHKTGQDEQAIQYLTQALRICEENAYDELKADTHKSFAVVYEARGDKAAALEHYGQAFSYWVRIRDSEEAEAIGEKMTELRRRR